MNLAGSKMTMKDIDLLQALINARGPSGQEDEVRAICEKEFKDLTTDTWIDPAGNVVGKISGTDPNLESLQIHIHMDELSLIVKRINEDGSLRVNPLGGIYPANY
jgi:putative aminopeptidase FrvX